MRWLLCMLVLVIPLTSSVLADSKEDELFRLRLQNAALKARIDAGVRELTKPIDSEMVKVDQGGSLQDYQSGKVELPADHQPTPWPEVSRGLSLLNLRDSDKLIDFGCGDARFLIRAARDYGTRGEGIEIDSSQAERACVEVDNADLSDFIEIINGDATTTDVSGNVGVAYLYPETLEKLKPKIEKLDRFASYQWSVPGLNMTKHGNWYLWSKRTSQNKLPVIAKVPVQAPAVTTRQVPTYDRLPQGSYCQQCGSYCRNPMSHVYNKTVVTPVVPSTNYSTTSSQVTQPSTARVNNCPNGNCQLGRRSFRLFGRR